MYAIDLFENTNPEDQSTQIPVAPHVAGDRNRQIGNANLAALLSALNNPENPSVSVQFLDGSREVLTPAQIDLITYYYNKVLATKVQRANFLYRTFVSRNKLFTLLNQLEEKKALAQAGQKSFSFAPDPVNPDEVKPQQLDLFKEEKKSSKYKDVAVQRAMRQAAADFPSAASDAEAFAKSMMVQQDQDKKNIDRLKSASQRNQELINKNDELDQSQARSIDDIQREINKVEKDNDSLTQMVQQMSRANAELQDKLSRMRSRAPATTTTVTAPEPQVGVSVATDKAAPAEPEAPSSPIDIGARQKIDQVSKAVVGQILSLQNKEAAQGLTPVEQERLDRLEAQVAKLSKQIKRSDFGQIPAELVRLQAAQNDPYARGVANAVHEDLTHGLEEGSVFGQQDFETQRELAKMKTDLAREKPAQTAPQSTAPAQPQPVAYKSPERLSDLQARHQKVEALFNLKKKIEAKKATATAGGRILPRGLAADLEDYYSMDDIDTHYDQMLAAYQKQLKAIEQYLSMKKILNKKVTHEMRANELQETKESPAWEEGGREGYYSRPNKNPYKPGTQEHSDYNRGYEQFKGDKDWDVPKRPMRENEISVSGAPVKQERGYYSIWIKRGDRWSPLTKYPDRKEAEEIKRGLEKRGEEVIIREGGWKKETPWTKSTGKDPRGEVTHMSDVARRETERREREDSPMNQLFKDFEKVFGKKPPVKEGDVVNINRGGYNQFRDKNDFLDKRDYVQQQLLDPRQRENYAELKQRLQDINYAGRKLGYI